MCGTNPLMRVKLFSDLANRQNLYLTNNENTIKNIATILITKSSFGVIRYFWTANILKSNYTTKGKLFNWLINNM